MPARQDTFKLVPTTLVNTTGPRPPMTSKAAKKAYREANKLPKISKAEQRRIEAAEIARQKKEYEKEKAAAKAKAAREKKLKKEAEERAKRKQLGLPEPSRFVRPSQPTIKTFVKSGAGRKRSWEEVNSMEEEHTDTGNEDHNELQPKNHARNAAKRTALEQEDKDDEFGDFPSLSQAEIPTLFVEQDDTSRTLSIQSSPSKPPCTRSEPQSAQFEATEHVSMVDQIKLDAEMAESQLLTKALLARPTAPSVHQCQSPIISLKMPSSLNKSMIETLAVSIIPELNILKTSNSATPAIGPNKSASERSRTMPPPALPLTVNRLRSRIPLNEISRNMVPPPLPSKIDAVTSTDRVGAKSDQRFRRENSSMPPPSTLAFLEANLDNFFPSPSQQVRELLEDIDDMPSNTQIAREIDLEQTSTAVQVSHTPSPLPESQAPVDDEALHFLSSQDLEISSQDLRDIDTPSKAMPRDSLLRDPTSNILVLNETTPGPPPTPKLKPRFFEEKEDDLLYAAMHESLLLSKKTTQSSSPRRSQRIFRRIQSAKTDHGCEDYGSDGSDLDAEFLALLDNA